MLKFFLSGYAAAAWQLLAETPMRAAVFPTSIADDPMVMLAMRNTDARIAADKPVTPGFLIAVLLWPDYRKRAEEYAAEMKPAEARTLAATDTLAEQQRIIAVPRRFSQFVRDVWQMQGRLETRLARSIERVAGHPRFRAAYDFLLLRAEAADFGSVAGSDSQTADTTDSSDSTTTAPLGELARWWTLFQEVSKEAADQMIKDLRSQQPQRKRRRRRRGRNQSGTQPDNTSQDGVECQ
jgi:poly(A) polymerase